MVVHHKSIAEVETLLNTDLKNGLSDEIQAERLRENGPNKLQEKKKKSIIRRFFEQFKDVMILILLGASAVSFAVATLKTPVSSSV